MSRSAPDIVDFVAVAFEFFFFFSLSLLRGCAAACRVPLLATLRLVGIEFDYLSVCNEVGEN